MLFATAQAFQNYKLYFYVFASQYFHHRYSETLNVILLTI